MKELHTFLKEIRIEKGLTQEEVAEQIGLTRQAISGYESGRRLPGVDILMKLAEIYDVSIDAILYGKKELEEQIKVKRIAVSFAISFFIMQILTGVLCILSSVLYPVQEGIVLPEKTSIMEKHFELLRLAETAEKIAVIILVLGTLILLGFDLSKRKSFSWKRKLAFFFSMFGISCGIAVWCSILHPTYGLMDFILRGPIHFDSVLVLLLIDLLVISLQHKKHDNLN